MNRAPKAFMSYVNLDDQHDEWSDHAVPRAFEPGGADADRRGVRDISRPEGYCIERDMIIQCQGCQKRHNIDEKKIPAGAKQAKCKICGGTILLRSYLKNKLKQCCLI